MKRKAVVTNGKLGAAAATGQRAARAARALLAGALGVVWVATMPGPARAQPASPAPAGAGDRTGEASGAGAAAAAGGQGQAPAVKVERGAGGKKVYRITEAIRIEGKIQKPEAFYVLQKSDIPYDWEQLNNDFIPKIVDSVSRAPF